MSVQSGSPFFAAQAFWCIVNTIAETPAALSETGKLSVIPYHINVPSFGDWGFCLASLTEIDVTRISLSVPTRFLNDQIMRSLFVFPEDRQPLKTRINRLDNQILVEYYNRGYSEFNE